MMYADWASVQQELQADAVAHESVLAHFPTGVGREVANSIMHSLAQAMTRSEQGERSGLRTEADVRWTMQVLCYGLTLPLSDHDTIRDCVTIYCDWLACLTDSGKASVPSVVVEDPNMYTQDMLRHLYNIFLPRPDSNPDLVKRQTVLCHRVLRTIKTNVEKSTILTPQTWDCVLRFLLSITDALLAPPLEKDSIGSNLCERVLTVLFELWILACARCFPVPPLWKTLTELCAGWRHHDALVAQWHRVVAAFTAQLLRVVYGSHFRAGTITNEDEDRLIPEGIDSELVVQCWFRFLHVLGNPVDLCRPLVISQTQKFLHAALTSEAVVDPHQHECLRALPAIFYRAMRSIAALVDSFLGLSSRDQFAEADWLAAVAAFRSPALATSQPAATTPPSTRKPRPSMLIPHSKPTKDAQHTRPNVADSLVAAPAFIGGGVAGSSAAVGGTERAALLSPCRPTVNSLLHLLGSWLLEASLVGVRVHGNKNRDWLQLYKKILNQISGRHAMRRIVIASLLKLPTLFRARTASLHIESDPVRLQSQLDRSLTDATAGAGHAPTDATNEAGRAQACGTLCRIFCSHRTGEEILPVYSSRFYISLYYALHIDAETVSIPMVLASVITNSCDLLRVDLDGVQVVLPQLLNAIQEMASRFRYKHDGVDEDVELRRATIHLLLSMLCLPLHFGKLPICAILEDQRPDGGAEHKTTFFSLSAPITDLLVKLLSEETDSTNTQMLLGGLVVCMLDVALYEQKHPEDYSASEPSPSQVLFGQASSLICNRLMMSWKGELGTALATLEVLSALTRVRLSRPSIIMCKRAVNWICEFVVFQCLRPAPAHSKDLHSMIVAAFHCLTTWLLEHDYLMSDTECMQTVLQVVELGISGSRSQARASDVPRHKGDKELKPVSMRVRDAAEALITVIIDYVGCFPPPCGPESLCTLLDEESLMKLCTPGEEGGTGGATTPFPDRSLNFQYFVLDGMTIVGLLERPLNNSSESLPTVTSVIRGSFGRHAWTMQLRHQPTSDRASIKAAGSDAPPPVAADKRPPAQPPQPSHAQPQYFPDVVQQIPRVLADLSIPPLESTMKEYQAELTKLQTLVAGQVQFEQSCRQNSLKQAKPLPVCAEPAICDTFQTARLFLSHYGFLTLEGLKSGSMSSMPASLVRFSTKDGELWKDLVQLDALPVRTADTVQVFFVRTGQNKLIDILENVTRREHVTDHFLAFVRSLGWPVDVQRHAGWTGSVATSWKVNHATEDKSYDADTGGSLYDGQRQVIYWSDVSSEVVFVVPSPVTFNPTLPSNAGHQLSTDSSVFGSSLDQQSSFGKSKSVSLDLDSVAPLGGPGGGAEAPAAAPEGASKLRRSGRTAASMLGADVQVVVVWLQSYEDHTTFPVADLVKSSQTGGANMSSGALGGAGGAQGPSTQKQMPPHFCIIFIHALRNGLFRIHLQSQHTSRESEAVPLVDGMVVSHRLLGHLVRQSAVNIFRRRQLDSDMYQPPHVRRKLKIKEIVEKYRCNFKEPEFYEALFQQDVK